MKKNKKLNAFSLAEVLVTLIIIGTITTLTIPTLKKHSDEAKYVASVQKAMSEITAATAQIELDQGEASTWDFTNNKAQVVNWYKKAMNVVPFPNNQDSWLRTHLSGREYTMKYDLMTADGMAWQIHDGGYSCGGGCALVDVNGINPPNILGIDIHGFRIGYLCGAKDEATGKAPKIGDFGIYAMGDNVNDKNNEWACTSYTIKHREMPWLYKPTNDCKNYVGQ